MVGGTFFWLVLGHQDVSCGFDKEVINEVSECREVGAGGRGGVMSQSGECPLQAVTMSFVLPKHQIHARNKEHV